LRKEGTIRAPVSYSEWERTANWVGSFLPDIIGWDNEKERPKIHGQFFPSEVHRVNEEGTTEEQFPKSE
jgi:hypothetical protein